MESDSRPAGIPENHRVVTAQKDTIPVKFPKCRCVIASWITEEDIAAVEADNQ